MANNENQFDNQTNNGTDVNGTTTPVYEHSEPLYRSYPEYKLYKFLIDHVSWINAFPGLILNPLCVYITIIMKPFNPTSLYMMVLGIVDFIICFITFAFKQTDRIYFTDFECTISWGIINAMLPCSNFILVAWTLERMIAVRFPLKVTSWCSMKNTKIVVALTLIFGIVISTPYFVHSRADIYGGCTFTRFVFEIWYYVDNAYYVGIPMLIICVSNMIILHSIHKTKKAHASMTQNVDSIEKRQKEQMRLTIMLVTISMAFIFFHVPLVILTFIENKYPDPVAIIDQPHAFAQLIAYSKLGYDVALLQNNVNFILYCSTGRKFRQTLLGVICFWRAKKQAMDGTKSKTAVSVISQTA